MWIVVSIKNIELFKSEIKKKFTDINFYYPKAKSQKKNKSINLLGNYLFCYSKLFKDSDFLKFHLKYLRGLKKFLIPGEKFQDQIINFIQYCKSHEDLNGMIKNTFFKDKIIENGKFLNGPFNEYNFSLIKKDTKKISVLIGEIKVSISDSSKFNYSTI
jgi:hypothetical protein|tara:strand:+ start:65 stop:541 length:477 start_codon:yes stop_codon:yes gene_type:complete